jgi:hypothetical protein
MDMTDNELLEQLFRPMREMKIEDDGFTERVMQQLSATTEVETAQRTQRLTHLWTAFCITIAVVLFILMRGWIVIGQGIYDLLTTAPTVNNLIMLIITVSVPALIALTETVRRERLSPI